ncbi:hypothetical protein FIU91_16680 [Roseivivax sp. THAF30]|nr:hypothetical protein FIU91_16680 [Roseivivax sp. THAF30]
MTDSSNAALTLVVQSSLASLETALGDMDRHPKVALRLALDEAETLSSATTRLIKLLEESPDPERVYDGGRPTGPTCDIEAVADLLSRLRSAAAGACPECGGVIMPEDA